MAEQGTTSPQNTKAAKNRSRSHKKKPAAQARTANTGGGSQSSNARIIEALRGGEQILNRFVGKYPEKNEQETSIAELRNYMRQLWQQARGVKTATSGGGVSA